MSLFDAIFGLSLKSQAVFFRQLANLVDAGVTVARGVETVASQSPARLRSVLSRMVPLLNEGKKLSDALALYPHFFSEFHVQMISAGEVGGLLDRRMKSLADYLEKAYAFQQSLVSQFIYPLVILHASIFVPPLFILVTKGVAPYLQSTLGVLVPLYALAFGAFLFFRLAGQASSLRHAIDGVLAAFPFLGKLFVSFSLQRFFRAFSELYEAGLGLPQAIAAAARACGNFSVASRLNKAVQALDGGANLSDALRACRIVPVMALQMLAAAEQAGSVGTVLAKVADFMEIEGTEALKRLSVILPVFIYLAMGAYVGYIIVKFYVGYFSTIFNVL